MEVEENNASNSGSEIEKKRKKRSNETVSSLAEANEGTPLSMDTDFDGKQHIDFIDMKMIEAETCYHVISCPNPYLFFRLFYFSFS